MELVGLFFFFVYFACSALESDVVAGLALVTALACWTAAALAAEYYALGAGLGCVTLVFAFGFLVWADPR